MNNTKTVYAYNADGKLIGEKTLDHTDRSPISGRWQIPAQCTEIEPPVTKDGYDIIWTGDSWEYQEIPQENDTQLPESDNTPIISDTAYVSDELIDMAETVIDLYDQIDNINERLTKIEEEK